MRPEKHYKHTHKQKEDIPPHPDISSFFIFYIYYVRL